MTGLTHLLSLLWHGSPAAVDVHDGYTQQLIRRATLQHEIEFWCGAGRAQRTGHYRRDDRAIADREQRLAEMGRSRFRRVL